MYSFIYKEINGIKIKLDVYLPSSATLENQAPILVWFHGGGLLQGSRERFPKHFIRSTESNNLAFVSVDYRLAPQVQLEDILSDISDALKFIINVLPDKIGNKINKDKWISCGSSAGGWLSLLVGLGVVNKDYIPNVCTAIYPITNTLSDFWKTPKNKAEWEDAPISFDTVKEYLDSSMLAVSNNKANSNRSKMYAYMVQTAILNDLLYGKDQDRSQNYVIPNIISKATYTPPIYIIHGTADTAVPIDQSIQVIEALKTKRFKHQFEIATDKDHLWDEYDENEDMNGIYDFINQHL